MKTKSDIFPDKEYRIIQERLSGEFTDKTGIFSSRVRPKLIEMFEVWFMQRKKLLKMVEESYRKKKKEK